MTVLDWTLVTGLLPGWKRKLREGGIVLSGITTANREVIFGWGGGREIGLISPEEGQGYHLAEGHRETIDSFRAAFIVPFQCSGNGIDCLSVMCTVPRNRYVSVLGDVAVNIFPLYSW